jgi:hypothetical protein
MSSTTTITNSDPGTGAHHEIGTSNPVLCEVVSVHLARGREDDA